MIANEVFMTGTAAEITRLVQEKFYDVVRNGNDPYGWLTFV